MRTQIQKWGNSLGIRIPMRFAQQLHLHSGSRVDIEIEDGHLIVRPPEYNLETMLEAITPKNQHHLFLDGKQEGAEEW